MHVHRLQEDQPCATGRPALLVGDVAVARNARPVELEERAVRRERNTVAYLHRAHLNRAQEHAHAVAAPSSTRTGRSLPQLQGRPPQPARIPVPSLSTGAAEAPSGVTTSSPSTISTMWLPACAWIVPFVQGGGTTALSRSPPASNEPTTTVAPTAAGSEANARRARTAATPSARPGEG